MRSLMKIPVLGKLLRIVSAVLKAPRRFDVLFYRCDLQQQQLEALQNQRDELQSLVSDLRTQMHDRMDEISILNAHTRFHSRLLDNIMDIVRGIPEQNARDEQWRRIAEGRIQRVSDVDPAYLELIINRICANQDMLSNLNRELSIHPTIWGRTDRLNIAKSASVSACLFNTNSGSITIGEYTFAGSNVSILAGSHDKNLRGFLRRDADITEGCDIVIGDGVWLGSGCMLLGPCSVGDNAVIAGGAVVTPGTCVPENTVYGGVPARKIAELDFSDAEDVGNPHIQSALERYNGLLFVDGWSEKKICPGIPVVGHWLDRQEGVIYVQKSRWMMFYTVRNVETCDLIFEGRTDTLRIPVRSGPLAIPLDLPVQDGETESFVVHVDNPEGKLFMMLIERSDDN